MTRFLTISMISILAMLFYVEEYQVFFSVFILSTLMYGLYFLDTYDLKRSIEEDDNS